MGKKKCYGMVEMFFIRIGICWASLVAQLVKHKPVMQKTWVQSLGQEDPLKQEMETHSSIFAWTSPWTDEPGRL